MANSSPSDGLTDWSWLEDYSPYHPRRTLLTALALAMDAEDQRSSGRLFDSKSKEECQTERTYRRRAQMEAMAVLYHVYSETGVGDAGPVLAAIVADAVEVARFYEWEPGRNPIPPRVRTLVYRRDGYACIECGADDIARLTIDHRHPVSLGGSDDPSNLRTLCKSCNSSKGARL